MRHAAGPTRLAERQDVGAPGERAYDVFLRCFEAGLLIRTTGDIAALSPPLIIDEVHIDQIFDILGTAIREAA